MGCIIKVKRQLDNFIIRLEYKKKPCLHISIYSHRWPGAHETRPGAQCSQPAHWRGTDPWRARYCQIHRSARHGPLYLPQIEIFADSPFNDDPYAPNTWSDWVKEQKTLGKELVIIKRRIPFVDLPVSATEDRVVGTLDIEKAIQKGERHFEPGVLAAPTAACFYIDEVNLLDDHVVDILLDSAAMGVNIVEREGISFATRRASSWSAR